LTGMRLHFKTQCFESLFHDFNHPVGTMMACQHLSRKL